MGVTIHRYPLVKNLRSLIVPDSLLRGTHLSFNSQSDMIYSMAITIISNKGAVDFTEEHGPDNTWYLKNNFDLQFIVDDPARWFELRNILYRQLVGKILRRVFLLLFLFAWLVFSSTFVAAFLLLDKVVAFFYLAGVFSSSLHIIAPEIALIWRWDELSKEAKSKEKGNFCYGQTSDAPNSPIKAKWLLWVMIPGSIKVRRDMISDLDDQFESLVKTKGSIYAKRWYWHEALKSIRDSLWLISGKVGFAVFWEIVKRVLF